MKVTIRPTRAVITIGTTINDQPGVDVEVRDLARVDAHVETYTTRTAKEKTAFRRWLANDAREVGEHWTVEDEDGDNVASVVLI